MKEQYSGSSKGKQQLRPEVQDLSPRPESSDCKKGSPYVILELEGCQT